LKGHESTKMQKTDQSGDHERFKELSALAQAGALTLAQQLDLRSHLRGCGACREIYEQYRVLGEEGMSLLSSDFTLREEARNWDSGGSRRKLFQSIEEESPSNVIAIRPDLQGAAQLSTRWAAIARPVAAAVAAGLIVTVSFGAYRLGERKGHADRIEAARTESVAAALPAIAPAPTRQTSTADPSSQNAEVSRLEKLLTTQQREVDRLGAALQLAQQHADQLASASDKRDGDLRQLLEERDKLASQLAVSQDANKSILASLQSERDAAVSHTGFLEAKVADLTVAAQDQGRRLKDDEQYLSSDRDIRELMGARKLYIADVFDVDSVSRTRKPFGRVFYTQNKSLVFYAFDLDHQPGVKNASAFQVWGQKDSELNAESHPMNLGILYEDSESNRRWVLRTDDSKQLAEIDAVFVTVEPHGGSQKPTGKPFLYALLRKEANHP